MSPRMLEPVWHLWEAVGSERGWAEQSQAAHPLPTQGETAMAVGGRPVLLRFAASLMAAG